MTTLGILVADDNEAMRRGLKDLLETQLGWQVVGEAANGREALEKAVQLAPGVVILDVSMPELDGISAAPLIRQAVPGAELLVLSQHDAPDVVTSALEAGARGYVLKAKASRDLVPAIEAMQKHESFLSAEVAAGRLSVQSSNGLGGETAPAGGPVAEVSAKSIEN